MSSFGVIVTTILGFALAVGSVLVSSATAEAHHIACLLFLAEEIFALICSVFWIKHRSEWDGMSIIKAFCLAGFIFILMPTIIRYSLGGAEAQPAQNNEDNSGIITNNQSGGSDTVNNYGPTERSLSPLQIEALTNSLRGMQTQILLMSLGDKEANTYAGQVFKAVISSGVTISQFSFNTINPPQYGVIVFPNENDATAIESALNSANITFSVDNDMLPTPGSITDHFKNYIGLLVGLRND